MPQETPDWKKEAFDNFAAAYARDEKDERARRLEAGQFTIILEGAPDEPGGRDPAFQDYLGQFSAILRAEGLSFSQRAFAMDSAQALGYLLPEFVIMAKDLDVPAVAAISSFAGHWLARHKERKFRIKDGEVQADGYTAEDIVKLLKAVEEFEPRPYGKSKKG